MPKWWLLVTPAKATPWLLARAMASCTASAQAGNASPPAASTSTAPPLDRTTFGTAAPSTRPSRMWATYCGKRETPCEASPWASAATSARAVDCAVAAGAPARSSARVASAVSSSRVSVTIRSPASRNSPARSRGTRRGFRGPRVALRAFVQTRQHELPMAERFGGGPASVRRREHALEQLVAGLIHVDLAAQQPRDVDVHVLGHRAHRLRVRAQLDHREDRVADHVALAGRKEVDDEPGRGAQSHHLGRRRRRVHEPEAGPGRRFGLVEHAVHLAALADLLDVAERLLLDRREPAGDVALGRLRFGEVARLVAVHDLLVALEHHLELLAHLGRTAARGDQVLAAGELGRLAEHQGGAVRVELVERVADGRIRAAPRGRVRLAALRRHPEVLERRLAALERCRVVDELLRLLRGVHDRRVVAVVLDREPLDRLTGLGDAVDDPLRPAGLDADHDDHRDVRVRAGADQRAAVQVEVGAELQAPVWVWEGHRPLDVLRHPFRRRVRDVVDRQDDDVVAHADAAIVTPVAPEGLFA